MKPIGIIGGAGPIAGVSLLEQIFCLARDEYGCWEDADFPKVFLISFPFSDMLSEDLDASLVREELRSCLKKLREDGAAVIGIACNTLHAFLDEEERDNSDLLQLPQLAKEACPPNALPLILATSTSIRFNLYREWLKNREFGKEASQNFDLERASIAEWQALSENQNFEKKQAEPKTDSSITSGIYLKRFPCLYPDASIQAEVDKIITQILKGEKVTKELQSLIKAQASELILLGCTELSLYTKELLNCGKQIIDPLKILAKKLIKISLGV